MNRGFVGNVLAAASLQFSYVFHENVMRLGDGILHVDRNIAPAIRPGFFEPQYRTVLEEWVDWG